MTVVKTDRKHFIGLLLLSNLLICGSFSTNSTPQANVISGGKEHSLNLVIHFEKSCPELTQTIAQVSNLATIVNRISPAAESYEATELLAGVGFGPDLLETMVQQNMSEIGELKSEAMDSVKYSIWSIIRLVHFPLLTGLAVKSTHHLEEATVQSAPQRFQYMTRSGSLGEMPATGGDVFIHAKSNTFSKVFELAQYFRHHLPANCIRNFEDVYGFNFQNGRDLSGFIDGTANRNALEARRETAVNKNSGGSFCLTQKWIHSFSTIKSQNDTTLEGWVGRNKQTSRELNPKSATSHVARMTSGPEYKANKPFEIVRQSMPYGRVSEDSGLFFLAYAESPANFDFMLDRMVGSTSDGLSDDIMRLSQCVTGNYWYFPSVEELRNINLKYST